MMDYRRVLILGALGLCSWVVASPDEWFSDTSSERPMAQRLESLDDATLDQFILGRSFFSIPWVVAPSATTARDGLGPLFSANTCASCHQNNSGGMAINDKGEPLRALVFKLAQPELHGARRADEINIADPSYGRQISINGTGAVPHEANTHLERVERIFSFPDGTEETLEVFVPYLSNQQYGDLHPKSQFALRQALPLTGMGLIAKIDPQDLLEAADPEDSDGDGISGRVNWVHDIVSDSSRVGKYGWKAGQPTVLQQTADAAAHDMGLTNPLFPEELCTQSQTECLAAPRGRPSPLGDFDLPEMRLQAIVAYVRSFKAPRPVSLSEEAQSGKTLFTEIGCATCHSPLQRTREGLEFAPYSDFLLHDMGVNLADGRPEFDADTFEWRTTPLWGMGYRIRAGERFLHDARAATPLAAILWHGGEAEAVRDRFSALPAAQRQQILSFLEAL
ncbi:hypothetical protein L0B52_02865 [Suttonella sp. R2A3]|uniref:di-heme oxidoredictase family protein n=1 Tax=Suttonella sp. R2A3 TaxID=2908648 RepID=UPI001F3FEB75|nr:di-heme oxidoredictase family protein [Suttonella sp. R2A3]UJF25102.1 hypothetical protein L0B52_02865 [Suttonella sp. R2A3]